MKQAAGAGKEVSGAADRHMHNHASCARTNLAHAILNAPCVDRVILQVFAHRGQGEGEWQGSQHKQKVNSPSTETAKKGSDRNVSAVAAASTGNGVFPPMSAP